MIELIVTKMNNKILYIIVGVCLILILIFVITISVYLKGSKDKQNIVIKGVVYNKLTKKPISDAEIKVINYRHTSDSGYVNRHEIIKVDTILVNSNVFGAYNLNIKYSSFFNMIISKQNYNCEESGIIKSDKENIKHFYLKIREKKLKSQM